MEITTQMVKDLRQLTGAGVLDCRKALEAAGGDFERAAEILRAKGLAAAAKKADREAKEGLIGHYVHTGSKLAALIEVNCETDFVARTEDFQKLCKDLAMQVVAARPQWVRIEDVPAAVVEQQRQAFEAELAGDNKPAEVVARIIEGKMARFFEENCLLEQPFIKDESVKIKDLVTATVAKLGENIIIRRFARLEVGG
ncbi:MAG: translation elongation factor Ts [Anaerolineae bacterium]